MNKHIKMALITAVIAVGAYFIYSVADIYLSPDKQVQQIYLVPDDAVFIIQTNDPINDWQKFSGSAPWQKMKQAHMLREMMTNVDMLDSLVRENETLLGLVGKRDLLISVHKTRTRDFDFLMILDMQKVSKMQMLKDQVETVLKMTGSTVTQRKYNKVQILEMRDPETRDILYISFVDNHCVLSYTSKLVEASIDVRERPRIGLEPSFIDVEKLVAGKGLMQMYVNYAYLPQFMTMFLGEENEYITSFSQSMDFAGLYFDVHADRLESQGFTLRKDSADPYITAMLTSGSHKMRAHEIMPARTAFYVNLGFSDPQSFVKELESTLEKHEPEMFKSYQSTGKTMEKYFDISLEKNFISWMSGEFAIAQAEASLLGTEPELILAIRAKDIDDARKNMEHIEKRIKNRTPIKIKSVEYKGYEINYVEMKGFFRLFFGGLFDKFEKPYYTYVDDYVIFSNKAASLLSFIEDYLQQSLLKNEAGFDKALDRFESHSTFFLYADVPKVFNQLRKSLNATTWSELQADREIFYSFPQCAIQIIGKDYSAAVHYLMNYQEYVAPSVPLIDETPDIDNETLGDEDNESETELMNELERFYVEKFQGNVLREFYPEGALKSESEVKEGKRHGKYREYYENGKLRLRGKYSKGVQKGTWKYYTEEGKYDRKEKY